MNKIAHHVYIKNKVKKLINLPKKLHRMYLSKRYVYPHPLILVVGLPQSASSWVGNCLSHIPGYQEALVTDPRQLLQQHLIDVKVIESISSYGYCVLKCHASPTPQALQAIDRFNLYPIVTFRDLRDQAVSCYFERLRQPNHPLQPLYNKISLEEGITHSIHKTLEEYIPFVEGWLNIIEKDPNRFFVISYENLKANSFEVFKQAVEFLKINLSDDILRNIINTSNDKTKEKNVKKEDRVYLSGHLNNWSHYFSKKDITYFKEHAGHLLIRLGYEQDLDWSKKS